MMKVSLFKIYKLFGMEEKYVTFREYIENYDSRAGWTASLVQADIPDSFKPHDGVDEFEGHVRLEIDGNEYSLEDVLGIGRNGEPTIVWTDSRLHCKRSFSLVPEYVWSRVD